MDILILSVLIFSIVFLIGVGVARFGYLVLQSSKTHLRVPDKPDKRRIDEAMIRRWSAQNLERTSQALLEQETGSGESTSGAQQEEDEDMSNIELTRRCLPEDLVTLALRDAENVLFPDKFQLYFALRELYNAGEYRHMGLLPSYLGSLDVLVWAGYLMKEEVVEFDWRFWKMLEETGADMLDQIDLLYCTRHFRRFVPETIQDIKMAVCPVCKKVPHSVRVEKVIARLDEPTTWAQYQQVGVMWINVFKPDHFFDFDEIEIGHCTVDQITSFCIEAANDPSMSRRTGDIHYHVMKDAVLDPQARVQLDKVFAGERPD